MAAPDPQVNPSGPARPNPDLLSPSLTTTPPKPRLGCWSGFLLLLTLGTAAIGLITWKFLAETSNLLRSTGQAIVGLGDRLQTQTVNETFRESVTTIISTQGDILELATVETDESFTRTNSKSLFGELLHLGTTISEIRVPVVYRYHLQLSDPWQIRIEGQRCEILAPAMRPSQPPAIRTDQMQKRSDSGWLRFNAQDNLQRLELDLTPRVEKRAGDERHRSLAREAARSSVLEFVKKWILDKHPDLATLNILIRFADEPQPPPTTTPSRPSV